MPGWLPAHVAWAYFTGTAFIVAGMAVLIGVCARLAAALSALQMGLFFVLVWVPAMATRPLNKFQRGEVLITWVLMAAAFQPVLHFYRVSPLWGFALPAIAAAYSVFTVQSAVAVWRGQGGQWKGRAQDRRRATPF